MKPSTYKKIGIVTFVIGISFIPLGYLGAGLVWVSTGILGILTGKLGQSLLKK